MDGEFREYRECDESYKDTLIVSNLDEGIKKSVLEQVNKDILVCIPFDEDSLDELVVKKMQMEEEIFPKLFNFRISCIEYDNVYMSLCEKINNFLKLKEECIVEKVKTQKEIDREKRLKYYSK
jgi:hypothetical protein